MQYVNDSPNDENLCIESLYKFKMKHKKWKCRVSTDFI